MSDIKEMNSVHVCVCVSVCVFLCVCVFGGEAVPQLLSNTGA